MTAARAKRILVAIVSALLLSVIGNSVWQWRHARSNGWSGAAVSIEVSGGQSGSDAAQMLKVDRVEPRSPASLAGLRRGDRIVALDGSPVNLVERFRDLAPGRTANVTVRGREQQPLSIRLQSALSTPSQIVAVILHAMAGLVSLLTGAIVLRKRPADSRSFVLFVLTSIYALTAFTDIGPVYLYGLYPRTNFLQIAVYVGANFLFFPALLHFCLTFPRPRPLLASHPTLIANAYSFASVAAAIVIALLAVLILGLPSDPKQARDAIFAAGAQLRTAAFHEPWFAGSAVIGASIGLWFAGVRLRRIRASRTSILLDVPWTLVGAIAALSVAVSGLLRLGGAFAGIPHSAIAAIAVLAIPAVGLALTATVVMVLIVPIASCIAFWRNYRDSGCEERMQLRWPLWGLTVGIAGFLLIEPVLSLCVFALRLAQDGLARQVLYLAGQWLPNLSLILIPLSIAFAIARYRLMDIDLVVRRTVIYGGVTGILGLPWIVVVAALGNLAARSVQPGGDWAPFLSTAFLAILLVPVRRRVQTFVDRRFYRNSDYAATLRALAENLTRQRDHESMARVAVDLIQAAIPARSASLWLRGDGGSFEPVAKTGPPDESLQLRISGAESVSRAVTGAGQLNWDLLAPDVAQALRSVAAESVALVGDDGRVTGFLTTGGKLSEAAYTPYDYEFLRTAAAQIAVALENAALRAEQEEMDRAREIQRALLPSPLPQVPGVKAAGSWSPARSVGGDYYDLFRIEGDRFAVAIGDVSGKGVGAALLMSNLQSALKLLACDVASPAAVCKRLNGMLCRNMASGKFVTFFYGVLNTAERTLTWCNAGHNPPILRRSGGEVVRLETGGPVLGVLPSFTWEEASVRLAPGDRLALFTDGLSEAFSEDGEEFGEDRIIQALAFDDARPQQLVDTLLQEADTWCHGWFTDDVTLMVVTVDEAASASAYS